MGLMVRQAESPRTDHGRRRDGQVVGVLLAMVILVALAPGSNADVVERLEAADNAGSAVAWSRYAHADDSVDVVIVARDDLFADALSSGALQGLAGAPLLLTGEDGLAPETAEELDRLFPDTVVLMGGTVAISEFVEADLYDAGYDVDRVFGADRVATAVDAASGFFADATTALLVRAYGSDADPTAAFADSLAAGAHAAATQMPILLSASEGLSPATADHLARSAIETVTVVGGEVALSAQVAADLDALGVAVTRVAGRTREETALALARLRFPDGAPDTVLLVDGADPDAWASGFPAASLADRGAAVLLTNGPDLPAATASVGLEGPTICGPNVDPAACDAADAAGGSTQG